LTGSTIKRSCDALAVLEAMLPTMPMGRWPSSGAMTGSFICMVSARGTLARALPPPEPTASGWRGGVIAVLRRLLAYLQRTAAGPTALNDGPRHHVADFLYSVIAWLAGPDTVRAWKTYTGELVTQVREVARRDPGRRILVVVNLRHCHHIRPALRRYPEIEVVSHADL